MVNFKAKTAKENKREKGIALIFTLIMLSLLLILALSFALDSMFEQKAAYNSANASAANLAAKTELNQLLSFLEYGDPNFSNSTVYSIGPYTDKGGTNHYDQDMLVNGTDYPSLLLTDGLITSSNINSLCFGATANNQITWTYQKDADGKLISRTAFVVIPQEKIPLDSLVDGRVGTTTYPKKSEEPNSETRIGKYMSEINVRSAIPNVTNDISTITDTLNWAGDSASSTVVGFDNGKYNGTWSSYDSLFSTLETAIGRDLTQTEKDDFENNLNIDSTEDSEAFWVDLDSDGNINSDSSSSGFELYKRFDLTRDWETADNAADLTFIKDKILLTSSGTEPNTDMEKWTSTDSDANSKGLPWLATFGYKFDSGSWVPDEDLRGTFATVKDRRYQIAANLKDYCDDDGGSVHRPTSDVDPSTWDTLDPKTDAAPTFTGNEKTPYIDKVGMRIIVLQDEEKMSDGPPETYKVSANVMISPCVELINIYGGNPGKTYSVAIEGTITLKTTVSGATTSTTDPVDFKCNLNVNSFTDWTTSGYSSLIVDNSLVPFLTGTKTGISGSRKVDFEVESINFTKISLYDTSNGYDYVKNLSKSYSSPTVYGLNSGAGQRTLWYGFAVHDPRQNLNGTTVDPNGNSDWLTLTSVENTDPRTLFSLKTIDVFGKYPGAPNSQNSANGGGDNTDAPNIKETSPTESADLETGVSDPANCTLSTALIRNAPMESPWELGFIHRGAKWQTLNLKKYVSSKAYSTISIGSPAKYYLQGGGAYSDGDANILDQIKMTEKASSPQKINIATKESGILDALFSKIKLGSDPSSLTVAALAGISPAGTEINLTDATYTGDPDGLRTKILKLFETFTTNNQTRSCVADDMATYTAGTNDAAQEELIGKTVNLTKINKTPGDGNYYIIVVSQTIKDVGVAYPNTIDIYKTPADDSLTAQKVECQLGRFDVTGTNANWKKNSYGDDITATQKILITTSKVNNKIKVTSLKYID